MTVILGFDPVRLVKSGLARGLIKFQPPSLSLSPTELQRMVRARRYSGGLNARGKSHQRNAWPELKGLTGSDYHKAYMKLYRANH